MDACVSGHSAYIYDRGGRKRIAQIKRLSEIRWSRIRDDISEAHIVVTGDSCTEQAATLSNVEPKRQELVIFRGGERVWEGVIWLVEQAPGQTTIRAHDIAEYMFGTPLTKAYDNRHPNETAMTTRLYGAIAYEMPVWEALDPPLNFLPHVVVHHWPNEAGTAAYTKAYQMTLGELVDNAAARSGIDYTMVGRALHLWDTSRSLGRIRTLTEADFYGNVIVTAYGSDHTEIAYVTAEDGRYGKAGASDPYYGPWTKVFTAYNEEGSAAPTQVELNSQAARNVSGRSPVPVEVRVPDNSSIKLSDSLKISDLVAGVQIPLRATLNGRRFSQMQKLDALVVSESATSEQVQVTLSPATRPDEDTP